MKDDEILGEEELQGLLSEFSCEKNPDVTSITFKSGTYRPFTFISTIHTK